MIQNFTFIFIISFVQGCSFIVANHPIDNLDYVNELNKRRGPDATNTYEHPGGWHFVHNLLHMTGEFTLQPFCNDDVCTTFNGEIYNYNDLFDQTFKSDGYSLLPTYKKYGTYQLHVIYWE